MKIDYERKRGVHGFVDTLPKDNLQSRTQAPDAFQSNGVTLQDLQFADQSGLSQMKTDLAKFAFAQKELQSGKVAEAAERFGNPFQK